VVVSSLVDQGERDKLTKEKAERWTRRKAFHRSGTVRTQLLRLLFGLYVRVCAEQMNRSDEGGFMVSNPPPMFDILEIRLSGGDIVLDVKGGQVRWCARFSRGGPGPGLRGVTVISHTEDPHFWEGSQWNFCFDSEEPETFDVALEMPPDVPRAKGLAPQGDGPGHAAGRDAPNSAIMRDLQNDTLCYLHP
jgi:hypothetical protein